MATAIKDPELQTLPGSGTIFGGKKESAQLLDREPQGDSDARQQTQPDVLEIPARMLEKNRAALIKFLDYELTQAEAERQPMMEKFARWKLAYAAPAADEPKHFPLWNSSNLTVPVIKEIVNTLAAKLVQSTLTVKPRWVLKDLASEWEPFVAPVERFLDLASDRDLKLDDSAIPCILETAKLGTGILEVSHKTDIRSTYKYTADGKKAYKSDTTIQDGPRAFHVPVSKFWIRAWETDIQAARWCAKELEVDDWELDEKAAQGKWHDVDKVKGAGDQGTRDIVEKTEQDIEQSKPTSWFPKRVFEVWVSWDFDGDHKYEQALIYYHKESQTILSGKFQPYWHGLRPFIKFAYFPREHRFWAEGLCEMLEDLQSGISDKHNKRADNAAMANLKMFLKRKMVKGLMPGDPLYMGKVIDVNDIWNDVREFTMAEIYPSTVAEEQIMRNYAERLSGHNDASAGSAMPVTRTTAAAQLALLQEQANRIDLTVRSIRSGLSMAGFFSIHLYFQFGTAGKALAWLGDAGRVVDAIFRLPRRVQQLGLAVKVESPTSLQNQQVKRENALALLNLLIQIHEKLWPFAQALAPQAMAQVAQGMVSSAHKYLAQVLETFDDTDPEGVLAGIAVLEKVLPAPEDLGGMESFRGRAESSQVLDKLGRLEGLLVEAEDSRNRGNGLPPERTSSGRVAGAQGLPRGGAPRFQLGGPPD